MISVDDSGHVVVSVFVQPGASREGIIGRHGDSLKVRVQAPPEAGKANQAVVKLLAKTFGLRSRDVELVSGATNRHKTFRLAELTAAEARSQLPQASRQYPR